MWENLREKVKENKRELIIYAILLMITCYLFSLFLSMHYATDTYNIMNVGYQTYATNWSFTDGRVIMGLIGLVAGVLHLPIAVYVILLLFLSLAISCGVVMTLKKIVEEYKKPKNKWIEMLILVIAYITVFNFMYLENLYFVEGIVMAMSLLFYLLAARDLVNKQDKYYVFKAIGWLVLGVISYQGTIGAFFTFLFVFTLLKNGKDYKQIGKDIGTSILIGIAAVGVDLLCVKIAEGVFHTEQTRLTNMVQIGTNLKYIISNIGNILKTTCELFPSYFYLVFIGVMILATGAYAIHQKQYGVLGRVLLIILCCIVCGFIVYLSSLSSFYTGRLRFTIGATMGMLFLYLYAGTDIWENQKTYRIILTSILGIYFVINTYQYVSLMWQHKEVNKKEEQEAAMIAQYIQEYEENNQITVDSIVINVVPANASRTYYEGTKNRGVLTYSALKCDWSILGALQYYTGRQFEKIEPDNVMKRTYEKKNGNHEKAYLCINDTLWINAYMY